MRCMTLCQSPSTPRASAAIGPKADLLVDANSGYSVHTAIKVGRMLERHRVFHLEEPPASDA